MRLMLSGVSYASYHQFFEFVQVFLSIFVRLIIFTKPTILHLVDETNLKAIYFKSNLINRLQNVLDPNTF